MGMITDASCPCGYRTTVRVGGSMATFRQDSRFPFHCAQCGVVSVNVRVTPLACPQCHTDAIRQYGKAPVSLPSRDRSPAISDFDRSAGSGGHLCPHCGQHTLEFDPVPQVLFD